MTDSISPPNGNSAPPAPSTLAPEVPSIPSALDAVSIAEPSTGAPEAPAVPAASDAAAIAELRDAILDHLKSLRLPDANGTETDGSLSKDSIRASHNSQRIELLRREWSVLGPRSDALLRNFADGSKLDPAAIDPELVPVKSDHPTADLFRFATLLWSVPVSRGYGRRMRYLVRDRANGKLIGIFALGDPVFNLQARDKWIGWNVDDRRARLVNVMDAYVVGAVPPYSMLLGGKLVASLIGSAKVGADFAARYGGTTGIISQQNKGARLVLVTVTSALGRSSLYNRLKLTAPSEGNAPPRTLVDLQHIGETRGYGHFQLSNGLFAALRELLARQGHPYAAGHQYGEGPNWRLRVLRVGLQKLGLDDELLRHGIVREVYAMPLAPDFRDYLCGRTAELHLARPTLSEIAAAALQRWVLPRAARYPEYTTFRPAQLLGLIQHDLDHALSHPTQLHLELGPSPPAHDSS